MNANPWGLHDLYGNVWEWVQDCYHGNYQRAPQDGSAWKTECKTSENGTFKYRVLRGGSWYEPPWSLRSASRLDNASVERFSNVGFRIAITK